MDTTVGRDNPTRRAPTKRAAMSAHAYRRRAMRLGSRSPGTSCANDACTRPLLPAKYRCTYIHAHVCVFVTRLKMPEGATERASERWPHCRPYYSTINYRLSREVASMKIRCCYCNNNATLVMRVATRGISMEVIRGAITGFACARAHGRTEAPLDTLDRGKGERGL